MIEFSDVRLISSGALFKTYLLFILCNFIIFIFNIPHDNLLLNKYTNCQKSNAALKCCNMLLFNKFYNRTCAM